MTCGFSSRVVGVSQGPLLSRTNQMGEHRALSKEFQIRRDSEEREAWSLLETLSSQFSLEKYKPVFLSFPYSFEFCASKVKSPTLPTSAPPQTSHFVLVSEKNMSS